MAEGKAPRLIPLPSWGEGEVLGTSQTSGKKPKSLRQQILGISFLVCVVLPFLLGALYISLIASDRYVAEAGFTVRGMEAGSGGDLLGAMTGFASTGSTVSDSYILLKYLRSRALVEKLERDFPFRATYSADNIDYFTRLDPTLDIEHVVEYWGQRLHTTFDATSGIINFKVEAFTPEAAEKIASLVLTHSRELVNELSGRARGDALIYAESEVERAELRLRVALDAQRAFREKERSIDPAGAARIQLELIGGLERQLVEIRARIAALQGSVAPDAPSLRSLVRQAEALEQQITTQRSEIGTQEGNSTGTALTNQLAAYETLEVEREFAQKAYASALSSLEKARIEADRQQRYLAIYVTPSLPEYPLYPRRMLNIVLLLAGLILVWGIGVLVVYAVRDHVS